MSYKEAHILANSGKFLPSDIKLQIIEAIHQEQQRQYNLELAEQNRYMKH